MLNVFRRVGSKVVSVEQPEDQFVTGKDAEAIVPKCIVQAFDLFNRNWGGVENKLHKASLKEDGTLKDVYFKSEAQGYVVAFTDASIHTFESGAQMIQMNGGSRERPVWVGFGFDENGDLNGVGTGFNGYYRFQGTVARPTTDDIDMNEGVMALWMQTPIRERTEELTGLGVLAQKLKMIS